MRKPEKMKKIKHRFHHVSFSVKNGPITQEFKFGLFGELKEFYGVFS
jgi:hypothetical protein